ncbi:hypothetical protein C9374_000718 [Naegleria lovaniensis]|uniref:Uncharacterized protein n=1 Tax=Naegleria lovaniensis TaxID=51637 RepID=A0AA88KNY7_NAELO|nr:uncharacterized protein C9374_000718 [Naegleria lovaniensis]KAG2388554.1 hypothetical protein C9374_000718 [Naegleria lovaniensis]
MVYLSDGNGRDGFIFLGPHERYGAYGKIVRQIHGDQQQIRHNEMWDRLDKKVKDSSSLRETHYRLAPSTSKVHGAPSEVADHKYLTTNSSTNRVLNTASSQLPKRRTVSDVPRKIPNYQGHIPGTHDVIGASPFSSKFEEKLLNSFEFHANTLGGGLNGSLSLPSLNNNKRSLNVSETSFTNLPDNEPTHTFISRQPQHSKQETSFRVAPSTKSFSKFVSPMRTRKENHHHAASYSGHVPSSTRANQIFNASQKH